MERLVVKTLIAMTAAIALSACAYETRFQDCAVRCAADGSCPDGLACGGEGLCRAPGNTALCGVVGDGGYTDGGYTDGGYADGIDGGGSVVVTTLAGTPGATGSTDGMGTAARFSFPLGVAVDSEGNVYVADEGNQTVRQVSASGAVTTVAGSPGVAGSTDGTGSAARFNTPTGVALDGNETGGTVYVVDYNNDTVRTVAPGGVVATLAGIPETTGSNDGTGAAARFDHPVGAAGVDANGNIYVADADNDTIRMVTPGGVVTTLAGNPGIPGSADGAGSAARFNVPYGVAIASDGNVYVVDSGNATVRKITPTGVVTTIAGSPGVPGSVDGAGSAARFNYPQGMAADSAGNLYVADSNNETIRMVTSDGVVTTLAGSPGVAGSTDGTGSAALFDLPRGVAVGRDGSIYVTDSNNNTVRKIMQ